VGWEIGVKSAEATEAKTIRPKQENVNFINPTRNIGEIPSDSRGFSLVKLTDFEHSKE